MPPKRKAAPRKGGQNKKIQLSDGESGEPSTASKTQDKMAAQQHNREDMIKKLQALLKEQGDAIGPEGITFVNVPSSASEIMQTSSQDPLVPIDLSMDSQSVLENPTPDVEMAKFEVDTQEFIIENEQPEVMFTADSIVACNNVSLLVPINFDESQGATQDASTVPTVSRDEEDEHVEHTASSDQFDWKAKCEQLEEEKKRFTEQLKKTRKKLSKAEADKLSSDDYALRIAKELQLLKDAQKIPRAKFTTEDDIPISLSRLEEYNERATSDSMFVGLLAMHLVGDEKLRSMSVTGQASHRFAKLKRSDGTPLYPPTEKINPKILEFICNKVAERTALRIGPENVMTIRKKSEEKTVKRYIAQKISNMKKSVKLQAIENRQ